MYQTEKNAVPNPGTQDNTGSEFAGKLQAC